MVLSFNKRQRSPFRGPQVFQNQNFFVKCANCGLKCANCGNDVKTVQFALCENFRFSGFPQYNFIKITIIAIWIVIITLKKLWSLKSSQYLYSTSSDMTSFLLIFHQLKIFSATRMEKLVPESKIFL